jgi:hypothetical protein
MADFYYHRSNKSSDCLNQLDEVSAAEFNSNTFNIVSSSSRNASRNNLFLSSNSLMNLPNNSNTNTNDTKY